MSTSTPRTDAAIWPYITFDNAELVPVDLARTLERELNAEREKAERYRLATLRLDAELAAEREKVRVLTAACESICDEWGRNHDANPIGAGQKMSTMAGKVLEKVEQD